MLSLKKIVLLTCIFITYGCGSAAFIEQKDKANEARDEINRIREQSSNIYVDTPPVSIEAVKINKPTSWSDSVDIEINTNATALGNVLGDISRRLRIPVHYDRDVDKDAIIKVNVNGSLTELANSIESQTEYKVDLTKEHSITVLAWETETFSIATLAGKHSYMIGKSGGGDLSSGESSTSDSDSGALFNADQAQYSSITSIDASEIEDSVNTILGIVGSEVNEGAMVQANQASGTITVTARPRTIQNIQNYIDNMNDVFMEQVRVQAKVITFQSTKNNSFGIDWSLLRKATDGALEFATNGAGGLVDAANAAGTLSYSVTSGDFDGASIFVNALQEQGNVAITTQPSAVVMNNRVGEVERLRKEGYAKDISIPNSDSDSDVTYSEVTQGVVSEGFSMRVLPKIIDDEVLLQLSVTVSKLGDFGVVDLPNLQLRTPNISEERFNQAVRVKSGMTVILADYNQGHTSSGEKKSFENPWLGGNSGSDQNTQTIVLLTVTILK